MATSIPKKLENGIEFSGWRIISGKQPISNREGREKAEEILQIPLPCMYFGENYLRVTHLKTGFSIELDAMAALSLVNKTTPAVKVGWSEEWHKQRQHAEEIKKVIKPFDWTYTSDYRGSLCNTASVEVTRTDEQLDIECLKRQEPILLYDDIMLYEDELDDNGSCVCSVRVVRINDTRIHHKFADRYLLRECISQEGAYEDVAKLARSASVLRNPDEVSPLLETKERYMENIRLLGDA